MEHMLSNFPGRPLLSVHKDICLQIGGLALREQSSNLCQRVGVLQQWAMRLIADALPDRFRRSPQTNNQRVVSETGKVHQVDDQASACRDDQIPLRREFRHHFTLGLAEGWFALFCKNGTDRFVCPRFDKLIRVHKSKVQLPGNNPADRRFPGSHEAHKGQVVNLPVTGHDSVLAQISGKFKVQTICGTAGDWVRSSGSEAGTRESHWGQRLEWPRVRCMRMGLKRFCIVVPSHRSQAFSFGKQPEFTASSRLLLLFQRAAN